VNNRRIFVAVAGVACLALVVVALLLYAGKGNQPAIAVATNGCDQVGSINRSLAERGFTADQYKIGFVDWSASEANERGNASFKSQTPRSAEEVVTWLNDGSAESRAVFESVSTQSGAGKNAILKIKNWIPVQFAVPILLPGNTGYENGAVTSAGTRNSGAGDVIWFFVSTKNCDAPPVVVRAGCGNPQTELPRPVPSPTPTTRPCGNLCKGPDTQSAPCVDANGVRCDGIPGSGGQPGKGGAINHGDDGYSPADPPPPTIVPPAPPPTSAVTLPPTSTPPTTSITAPPG
jgi:hypothetical protein